MLLLVGGTTLLLRPDLLAQVARFVNDLTQMERIGAAVLLNVLLLAMIALQLRLKKQVVYRDLALKATDGTISELAVDSATEYIESAMRALPGVHTAKVGVQSVGGRALIELDVTVDGGANLHLARTEINSVLKGIVDNRLQMELAEAPRVRFHLKDVAKKVAAAQANREVEKALKARRERLHK